jgi:hypothetical protein
MRVKKDFKLQLRNEPENASSQSIRVGDDVKPYGHIMSSRGRERKFFDRGTSNTHVFKGRVSD